LAAPDESPPTPFPADMASAQIQLGMNGRIDRADIPGLCERARVLLVDDAADQLVCDVAAIVVPDAVTVDALARLHLTARRLGRSVLVEHASAELRGLLTFMGLSDAVPLSERSGLEAGRETEEREQRGRVEEERDPADPST
jgi:ABC-type transporter Mla MlaB component